MISNKALVYGILLLIIFNYVIAEEVSSQSSGWQFPLISGFRPFGSSGPFGFPSFSGLSGLFDNPSITTPDTTTTAHSRERREANNDDDENGNNELQSRLLFIHLSTITSCNYTTQGGSSCLNCRQTLRCLPTNVGVLKSCTGLFRYCNNGRCSLFQDLQCSETTSTPTSTTLSSTTTTSTSTTSPTTVSTSSSD
ncbi:unnamed protein product [Diatraea saccharalis]|uniref:Uncharacterized protein n=1 Tax=Diatraea saccharalis TaxID=40085 RepID=A0A9N9R2H9_9NEOP|nr:unnamed protein product [Diatraea saccharalis]